MVRFTRFSILLLAAVWLTACATEDNPDGRPSFADGTTRTDGGLDTQVGGGPVCTARPLMNQVGSGEAFGVTVTIVSGVSPFRIGGSSIASGSVTVSGSLTNSSTTLMQMTRRISFTDGTGLTGSCSFTVLVAP